MENRPFHTFLWKVASRCNINCSYCYVYNRGDVTWKEMPKFMSPSVATLVAEQIKKHLLAHGKSDANIIFHGGEPLLLGHKRLSVLFDRIKSVFDGSGIEISLGLQTNLLLFDETFLRICRANNVSIGVSVDGPPGLNDRHRVDMQGNGTGTRLEEKLALLTGASDARRSFGGFLCVVDPEHEPDVVYDYLSSFSPPMMDFLLPLNNHANRPPGKARYDDANTPYGRWMVRAFDRWLADPAPPRIRYFSSIINMVLGVPSCVETIGLTPVDLVVVESDGSIEAVDSLKTAFSGAAVLGYSIFNDTFDTVSEDLNVKARQIGEAGLCQECRRCPVMKLCGGGYYPHRYSTERGFNNPSIYCSDLKVLIAHIARTVARSVAEVNGTDREGVEVAAA